MFHQHDLFHTGIGFDLRAPEQFGVTSQQVFSEAMSMIVLGFMEPFTRELPMEYAVELNRLIQMEMEGSVG